MRKYINIFGYLDIILVIGFVLILSDEVLANNLQSRVQVTNQTVHTTTNTIINHPFPQSSHISYHLADGTNAIYPANRQDSDATQFYDYWKTNYITSAGNINGHPLYRVKFGKSGSNANITVSEGQGYGMIASVIMAGYDPDAQATFDGLFRYARAHPSSIDNRLMAWQQPPQTNSSAFDGDADIALALVLADKQWGSSGEINYANEAKNMIAGIRTSTIGIDSHLPMLGDWVSQNGSTYSQWTPRSSDFMLDNFRNFGIITGDRAYWDTVINNSHTVIGHIQNQYSFNTGLLPDFIVRNSQQQMTPAHPDFLEGPHDGDYFYNAGRDPWRIGIDALLNNDATSLAEVRKMSSWIESSTANKPLKINAGYILDGTKLSGGNYFTSFFAAPFGVAAMTGGSAQQQWLNGIYNAVKNNHEDYYEDSVTLMCLLIMTGNYWGVDTYK